MQFGILYGSLLDFSYKEHCIHSGELALYAILSPFGQHENHDEPFTLWQRLF